MTMNRITKPKIEIIILAYNCEKTLPRTLDSLVKQTDKDFLLTIIDDCSTQPTVDICEQYRDKFNMRYFRNEINLGCGMSRQKGLDLSVGDYISFVDSDDVLAVDTVEIWKKHIPDNPDYIFAPFLRINQDGTMGIVTLLNCCIGKLYKRKFLQDYNIGLNKEVYWTEDTYMSYLVTELAEKPLFLDQVYYYYIENPNSITHTEGFMNNKTVDGWKAFYLALKEVLKIKPVSELRYAVSTLEDAKKTLELDKPRLSDEQLREVECYINRITDLLNGGENSKWV